MRIYTFFLCTMLGALPAQAGIFDRAPEKPAPAQVSDATIQQIKIAFDDQRYLDAGKLLDQALLVAHGDPRLTYWAAELSLARGRYQDALTNFSSIKTDPKVHTLAMAGEGIALAKLGRSQEAIMSLQAAVTEDPKAWRAWNALGSEYDRKHEWANAEAAYGHALSASGGAAIVLNNRGFSWLSQKKLDLAISDFVAALQKKPDLAPARANLRLAMSMQGEYERAVNGAVAADQAIALNNAGYAAMLRGDYDKAKDLFTRAMKVKGGYYSLAAANLEKTQNLANGGLAKGSEGSERAGTR
jgi:Flp pilus assembly protein TadD